MATSARSKWRLTPERDALLTAALAMTSALSAPIIAELVKTDSPPQSCIDIQIKYADAISKSPEARELIMPGVDGKSTLLNDPQAAYCGLTPDSFTTSK
jgi:hypothetical protein